MEDVLYKTVSGPAGAEIEEKSSRFIAMVARVESREAFRAMLAGIEAEQASATHHCWAFRIGFSPVEELFSDDGEPSGSAGLPILRVLAGKGLVNIACVVTRYFGGTKLGIGGLIRAYSQATSAALREAEIIEVRERLRYRAEMPYRLYSEFEALLKRRGGGVIEAAFGAEVAIVFDFPRSREFEILSILADISAGSVIAKKIEINI